MIKRSIRTTTVLAALLVGAGVSHAGGYVSLGVGAEGLSGRISDHFESQDDSSVRVAVGKRFGNLALEASLQKAGVTGTSSLAGRQDYDTATVGLRAKLYMGLGAGLEGYGHVGLVRAWMLENENTNVDYDGRGYQYGAGLEYGLRLSFLSRASLWLDWTRQDLTLNDPNRTELQGEIDQLTIGLSLGF